MPANESFLDIIQEHLRSNEILLPVFDRPAPDIRNRILADSPDLEDIERLILRDPAFTFHVLKAANSAFFKGLTKVTTIKNAIIRLGTGEIARIISELTTPENLQVHDPFSMRIMKPLWLHATVCAVGTRWVAEQCRFESLLDESFIAGQLHDIGKLLLIAVVEHLGHSDMPHLRPSDTLLTEVMKNFHAEHGFLFMEKWGLPEYYSNIARSHHFEDADPNNTLQLMVRLVNKACNKLGIGINKDSSIILAATQEASMLGLSEIFLAKLEIMIEDALPSERPGEPAP